MLLSLFPNTTVKLGNEPITCRYVTSQTIYTTGKADITIFTKCPNDPVYVTVQKAPDSAETPRNNPPQVQAIYRPEADGNVERADTTEAYQAAMRRVFNRQRKNKPPPAGSGCLWVGAFLKLEAQGEPLIEVLTFQK